MNDAYDNAADDKAMLEQLRAEGVGVFGIVRGTGEQTWVDESYCQMHDLFDCPYAHVVQSREDTDG